MIKISCPYCEAIHNVKEIKRTESIVFKGKNVTYDAIHYDNENKEYVYKLEETSGEEYKIVYTYVTVGTKGSYYTEIASGLSEGDVVLSSSIDYDNGDTISSAKVDSVTSGESDV